ncbi:MAG: cytochrome c biogenesis protein ResB [Bowdeniella nasicola]|nr:cytochrome c biogenesis protein ResB [Bowdeniella nasicola]
MREIIRWARWSWRQLTSMRVAIYLLLILALGATPGSYFPQRATDAEGVETYLQTHPVAGPILDQLGMFNVYTSVWFAAIYLLLFISLIGCIIPRTGELITQLRQPPVRIPTNLARFEHYRRIELPPAIAPTLVLDQLSTHVRERYRLRRQAEGISAERGYLKEAGNLIFHYGLVAILVAFSWGQLTTYRGQAIVVEGRGFANALVDYDSFQAGAWFHDANLTPFALTLDDFTASFTPSGRPEAFRAEVSITEADGTTHREHITPNHPVRAANTAVTLSGNGYAPIVRVWDGAGAEVFAGPVPFIPEDASYRSRGVIKVPDVSENLDQLGFSGAFLPFAVDDGAGTLTSAHPSAIQPLLVLDVWHGDLGLDDGIARNAYQLHTDDLTQVVDHDGQPYVLKLAPGERRDLPDDLGAIEFVELQRFVSLDIRHDPSTWALLGATLVTAAAMCVSLFVPRRRLWATVTSAKHATVLEVAGLARGEDARMEAELDWLVAPVTTGDTDG